MSAFRVSPHPTANAWLGILVQVQVQVPCHDRRQGASCHNMEIATCVQAVSQCWAWYLSHTEIVCCFAMRSRALRSRFETSKDGTTLGSQMKAEDRAIAPKPKRRNKRSDGLWGCCKVELAMLSLCPDTAVFRASQRVHHVHDANLTLNSNTCDLP
ncbi:hypothetical protein P153DRAFT_371141 [Dothidotthia symphoricarpi CBS 119687]|uniref:Uncharacterized protein n=1 Tax=Dothidotthia symphoricarpi CBS 119687 TaxID=1392245 RepID=A0A6A5ZZG3_9PLEO|nr:uncharacterized protein P153DRAFT_371141 [Dothidotthia symphoricarpi CBS 119687]KAF2124284.1 hypothetical protein P153DRAFT_371141 [Dothidotthia symphoricarpi CBS 119687]